MHAKQRVAGGLAYIVVCDSRQNKNGGRCWHVYLLPTSGSAVSISRLFKLNAVGEVIWHVIDQEKNISFEKLLYAVQTKFLSVESSQLEKDLTDYVLNLADFGIVRVV